MLRRCSNPSVESRSKLLFAGRFLRPTIVYFMHSSERRADDLVGASARSRKTAAYRIVYRGFEHSDMRSTCIDAAKPALPRKMSDAIGVGRFPEPVQVAARAFVFLQERRHWLIMIRISRFPSRTRLLRSRRRKFAIGIFGTAGQPDRRNFPSLHASAPAMSGTCRLYLITPPRFEPRVFAEDLKRALGCG